MDAGRALYDLHLDAVKGYREFGYYYTGHAHWKDIKPERLEAGARAMADMVGKLPGEAQAQILKALVYARIVAVGSEVFVDPVAKSVRIRREEKRAKEEAAKKAEAGEAVTVEADAKK